MRSFSTLVLALACGAVVLFPACSGGPAVTPSGSPGSSDMRIVNLNAMPPRRLAVTNFFSKGYFAGTIVLNRSYKVIQTITNNANNCPAGAHYDSSGNLYVANIGITGYCNPAVLEYSKAGKLMFTYSTGLGDPGSVTVDRSGNVYVGDWGDDKASVVVEYPQRSNKPLVSCSTGYANSGVAIDSKGHVFVSVDVPNGSNGGYVLEYKQGLSGCHATRLGVTLKLAGPLVIDSHDNLVACDRWIGVDIIPPPYTKVRSTITGFSQATAVALNKQQNLLYVVNFGYPSSSNDVVVDTYPGGKNVATLGAKDGISSANGVAAFR